jgi:hypothetical protein
MKTRSYFAVLKSEEGSLLLGGTREHVSSRFSTEKDAAAWMRQAEETNAGAGRKVAFACVYASEKAPEIEKGV